VGNTASGDNKMNCKVSQHSALDRRE